MDRPRPSGGKPLLAGRGRRPGLRQPVVAPLLEFPALFRTFAGVEPTREGVLAFANLYGGLGTADFFSPSQAPELSEWGAVGETLSRWAQEISRMKEAVTLLDLVRARDEVGLARLHCSP